MLHKEMDVVVVDPGRVRQKGKLGVFVLQLCTSRFKCSERFPIHADGLIPAPLNLVETGEFVLRAETHRSLAVRIVFDGSKESFCRLILTARRSDSRLRKLHVEDV